MKKILLLLWGLGLVFFYGLGRSQGPGENEIEERKFPDGYMESNAGVGLVLFFTGDIKGNFEPCG